jgi:N-acetylneuraminic acid mutarotase
VVAGGVTRVTGVRLARRALWLDLRYRRWSFVPGPTPREHLGVAAVNGKVYAVGGRLHGLDTNLATFETWAPGARRWKRLPPVPKARGGTGAAAVAGRIVSVGGEELGGTIAEVYAYRVATGMWQRLPNVPSPRHGLGVVAARGSVFVIGGGPTPGLSVTGANESLRVSG